MYLVCLIVDVGMEVVDVLLDSGDLCSQLRDLAHVTRVREQELEEHKTSWDFNRKNEA